VFLFGGKCVYRNIFDDKKFVEVYLANDVKSELGLTREDLIALAFLLGSDYCEGIYGVGLVNAMEIVSSFSMKQDEGGIAAGLTLFRKWLESFGAQDILQNEKISIAEVIVPNIALQSSDMQKLVIVTMALTYSTNVVKYKLYRKRFIKSTKTLDLNGE
jgi:5'-3' exonuclease